MIESLASIRDVELCALDSSSSITNLPSADGVLIIREGCRHEVSLNVPEGVVNNTVKVFCRDRQASEWVEILDSDYYTYYETSIINWRKRFVNEYNRKAEIKIIYDLADFFPLGLNLKQLTDKWDASNVTIRLSFDDRYYYSRAGFVLSDCAKSQAGLIHTAPTTAWRGESAMTNATVQTLSYSDYEFPQAVVAGLAQNEDAGLLALEGRDATDGFIIISAYRKSTWTRLFEFKLPVKVTDIRDFYRWLNYRAICGDTVARGSNAWPPYNSTIREGLPNVFFVHGANVAEAEAEVWAAEMFKRLYWAGAEMNFYGVTWYANQGLITDYHQKVVNAFATASAFASDINAIGGERNIILAHSLGTMLSASAIQDHGANVEKLLIFNSAIPSEAFDDSLFDDSPQGDMVHDEWREYTNDCWTANWHELFPANDARSRLTWKGRFAPLAPKVVNFYSSGDEVLDIYEGPPNPEFYNGFSPSGGWGKRYVWQKQELYKGRSGSYFVGYVGTTSWAGWGFKENMIGNNTWSAAQANAITNAIVFATNTVFQVNPPSITNAVATRLQQDVVLAMGIPALSPALGRTAVNPSVMQSVDMNDDRYKPHGWIIGRGEDFNNRILHSDIKDVSFFFTFEIFNKILEKGELR